MGKKIKITGEVIGKDRVLEIDADVINRDDLEYFKEMLNRLYIHWRIRKEVK